MKLFSNIYVAIGTLILSIIVLFISFFNFQLGKVSDDDSLKKIVINPGSIDMIATVLYDNNLIKDKLSKLELFDKFIIKSDNLRFE